MNNNQYLTPGGLPVYPLKKTDQGILKTIIGGIFGAVDGQKQGPTMLQPTTQPARIPIESF